MDLRVKSFRIMAGGLVLASMIIEPAYATDASPVIVIPGHVGVPVILDGIDATGAVVYGDWGLSRPGHGHLIIEGGVPAARAPERARYFPSTAGPPVEEPPQEPMPKPRGSSAGDYRRSWSAGSGDLPAGDGPPGMIAPADGRSWSARPPGAAAPDRPAPR